MNDPKINLELTYLPFILNGLFHECVVNAIIMSIEKAFEKKEAI